MTQYIILTTNDLDNLKKFGKLVGWLHGPKAEGEVEIRYEESKHGATDR